MNDLFQQSTPQKLKPLAEQVRPKNFNDFIGQEHLIGEGKLLTELIKQQQIPSMIFWGPPGVGKTTLAYLLAQAGSHDFMQLSAVTSGIKEVKETIEKAKTNLNFYKRKTILFIDEIHRFNKAQQDAFLPHVEHGTIILIGATTENPSFEIIAALLSRCKVITLKPLENNDLLKILDHALDYKNQKNLLTTDSKMLLVNKSHQDARYLLNMLEDVIALFSGEQNINANMLSEKITEKSSLYDKKSEHHYNTISAFIKSLRGSDPDAGLYYLAKMLDAGEDPLFVARRMVIFASEDIGNANPQAIEVAVACMQSYRLIGMAEGWIPLAQCVTYLACSPKSNASYVGYKEALAAVKELGELEVPLHLRNAPTALMKDLGYAKDYQYAHHHKNNIVAQDYLPEAIKHRRFYNPTENGHEKKLKEWLNKIKPTS